MEEGGGCEWEHFERWRVVVVGTYVILVTVLFTFNASPMLAAPAGPMPFSLRLLGCGNLGQWRRRGDVSAGSMLREMGEWLLWGRTRYR